MHLVSKLTNTLTITVVPALAVIAGALVGNTQRAEFGAFFATIVAVGFLVFGWLRLPRELQCGARENGYCVYTLCLIAAAPALFDRSGVEIFWAVIWIVPIVCWLVIYLRERIWTLAYSAWLTLFACMIAVEFNCEHIPFVVIGLWKNVHNSIRE